MKFIQTSIEVLFDYTYYSYYLSNHRSELNQNYTGLNKKHNERYMHNDKPRIPINHNLRYFGKDKK